MRSRFATFRGCEDASLELLRDFDVALVAADTAGRHPLSLERTATFAYVRLHGATELYASRYEDELLADWSQRTAAWSAGGADVFVYFDNDARGHAPHDASRLRDLVAASGRESCRGGRPRRRPSPVIPSFSRRSSYP